MKNKRFLFVILCATLFLGACEKQPPASDSGSQTQTQDNSKTKLTRYYVNTFAYNMMDYFYLWKKEIAAGLKSWKTGDDPITTVEKIRYKDSQGNDIDRWTMVFDDYDSFYGSVTGNEKTYGFDFVLMYYKKEQKTVCARVTYTYPDSPAANAGLKRGDAIVTVNGTTMTLDNYDRLYRELYPGENLTVGVADEKTGTIKTVTLTARKMYENPVLLSKVFDCGDKKVGYLVYTSFTLDSYKDLIAACTAFKEAGVTELILDLRYNGGGFTQTEEFLASMLAPKDVVLAEPKNILSTEIYNDTVTKDRKEAGLNNITYFNTEFEISSSEGKIQFSTKDAIIDLQKLYAIISRDSASASEALLCDLYPYLDITLVGEKTHGKYCSGLIFNAIDDFYNDEYTIPALIEYYGKDFVIEGINYAKNWGLYVMYSRFADKNGETRCMPDGLKPDVAADDRPEESYQLGDPKEAMLAVALQQCGYKIRTAAEQRSLPAGPAAPRIEVEPRRADFGRFIVLPEDAHLRRTY